MVGKASSGGTKVRRKTKYFTGLPTKRLIITFQVTLGENAPSYREGAGVVVADSLAAESVQAGGEFASNRNITTNTSSSSSSSHHNPASTQPHETPAAAAASRQSTSEQGQPAPTYVNNQSAGARDTAGPHGKNITEDPEMTGRPGKFNVEVGSKEDPAREAEKTMLLQQTRGAPGTGEREVGVKGGDEQPYGALGGDTSA